MEVSSVLDLCKHLIFCAIQRCRICDELCRLSVVLKSCPEVEPPLVRISVSDTGSGSNLEEFQILRCSADSTFAGKWDGIISITTTSFSEDELNHFSMNLKETELSRRLLKLPSTMKHGAKFSGSEASLSTTESIDDLLLRITLFLQKMNILKSPKIALELMVENCMVPRSQGNSILAVDCSPLPSSETSIEHLKSGLEEYVLKHGNRLHDICNMCFSTKEHLKVGTGCASKSTLRSNVQIMEAVVVISEISEKSIPSCYRARGSMTEVLFFKDFTPCLITQSSLDALASIKWKDYGLSLKSIADQEDCIFLEWDSLPPSVHIDVALHSYTKQKAVIVAGAGKSQVDRTLTRKAVNHALRELKEKNDGALLSAHALKIQDYAPDLAKTMAGLILSSNDLNFKQECFSLLTLQFQNSERNTIEDCIKDKIISVISQNDRKPKRNRESRALIFEDCFFQSDVLDGEYEEGDELLNRLDF